MSLDSLIPQNPIIWIDNHENMIDALRKIQGEKEIGLDVETTLDDPPRLCTIQIATREKNYVFDALALQDLQPLFRILEDPGTVKIIHYAPFEIGVLGSLGVEIRNVFDTFRASQKLRGKRNRYYHSLAAVCRRELNHSLNKMYQQSDWSRRPLPFEQLQYAALDAEIMLTLYDVFKAETPQLDLPL